MCFGNLLYKSKWLKFSFILITWLGKWWFKARVWPYMLLLQFAANRLFVLLKGNMSPRDFSINDIHCMLETCLLLGKCHHHRAGFQLLSTWDQGPVSDDKHKYTQVVLANRASQLPAERAIKSKGHLQVQPVVTMNKNSPVRLKYLTA